jgi:PAS domain S-box-containing protein
MLRAPTTTPADAKTRGEILIVEDDVMVAAILQSRLKKMGYAAPNMVTSGEKAVEKVRENRPALVLMDIELSGEMDGIEAAQCIREQFDIPVIYLTSHTDDAILERASLTEPLGYIVKPFEEGELRAVIEIAFYRHQADQQLRKMERWLTTTLRSIGDGVIATDTEGCVTMLNPVAEAITGWKQAEATGQRFEEVFKTINEKTRKPIANPVSKSLKNGAVVNLEENGLLIAKDGRELPIDHSAAPIRDDDGKIIGVVVVFRDNTERKRAEFAVRQMNEQLEERVKQRTTQLEAVNRELEAFTYSVSHDMRGPIRSIDDFANAILEDYEKVLDEKGKKYLGFLCQNAQRMEKMIADFLRLSHLGHSQLQLQKVDMVAMVTEEF